MGHQFYVDKKIPNINETVWINVGDLSKDLSYLSINLLEYECTGIIQTKNLSRRMRSRKGRWRSYIPTKPVAAIVEDIDEKNNRVVVSRRHILDNDIEKYDNYFKSNNKITKLIQRMAIDFNEDFNDLWEKIIYPLQKSLKDEIKESNIFSVIVNKYKSNRLENLNSNEEEVNYASIFDICPDKYKEYLANKFKKLCVLKKFTVFTNFMMIAKPPDNILTLKKIYQKLNNKYSDIEIILDNSSLYYIELKTYDQNKGLLKLNNIITDINTFIENTNIYFKIKTEPSIK